MSKAFTKEDDAGEPPPESEADALPPTVKNYMTPRGHAALQKEFHQLLNAERPKIVETVSWAAGNGDRSENGDYIYGKKRLREIDRRLHYLTRRLGSAVIVDPREQQALRQVFFGACVTYAREDESEVAVQLVGVDEADITQGRISWLSPVAKALLKAHVGDTVRLVTPSGVESIEVMKISYPLDDSPQR